MPIAQSFDQVLVSTEASTRDVAASLGEVARSVSASTNGRVDVKDSLSRVQKMRNQSYTNIDVPAAKADNLVAEICRKYNKDKWFIIKAEAPGSMFGSGSGGMGLPGF